MELERVATSAKDDPSSFAVVAHAASCAECGPLLADIRANLSSEAPVREALCRLSATSPAPARIAPTAIGPYRVIREIGRGGMGVVYLAEQSEPRRQVAVKALHPWLDADGRIERLFHRESRALARLKHPGIAAIYESGRFDDHRAYIAMEFVDGESLIQFAKHRNLSISDRLRLFRRICDAVAYAHQRGVIHRDLKPANILVEPKAPASPTPKILDFGLARLVSDEETPDLDSFLTSERRVQGTLPYMSPEQVRGAAEDVDVRTDIYSLGVLLFELLTYQFPYVVHRGRFDDSARTICEVAPTRPSRFDPRLQGDLETIILKALEKAPQRRYASASALADDIDRLMARQPIHARPATLDYQLTRLIQRHRGAAILTSILLLVVIGLAVTTTWLLVDARSSLDRARRAETMAATEAERAKTEAATATRVSDLLVDMFRIPDPDIGRGRTITARQLVDAAVERVNRELGDEPIVRARLLAALGDSYHSLGLFDEAVTVHETALGLLRANDTDTERIADVELSRAESLRRLGRLEPAREAYKNAIRIMGERHGMDDPHVLNMLRGLADIVLQEGDSAAAIPIMADVVERMRQQGDHREGLVAALNSLSGLLCSVGRGREAIPLMREAIAAQTLVAPEGSLVTAKLQANLAWLLVQTDALDEAEPLVLAAQVYRERVLPPGHPDFASSSQTLGTIYLKRDRANDAEPPLRAAVALRERYASSREDPDLAECRMLLGDCLCRIDRWAEGSALLESGCDALLRRPEPLVDALIPAIARMAEHIDASAEPGERERWTQRLKAAEARADAGTSLPEAISEN